MEAGKIASGGPKGPPALLLVPPDPWLMFQKEDKQRKGSSDSFPDPATGESRGCVNLGVYSSKCSFCISYFELIFGHSQMFSGYRIWDWKYNGGLARSMILMLEANVRGAILT